VQHDDGSVSRKVNKHWPTIRRIKFCVAALSLFQEISTIHSSCASLLRRHAIIAGVDPNFAVCADELVASQMLAEAQTVIAYRTLGMAGLWAVAPSENARMFTEKPAVLMASGMGAAQAMISGQSPDKIIDAAVRPLGVKTRSNARRLSRRGPKFT